MCDADENTSWYNERGRGSDAGEDEGEGTAKSKDHKTAERNQRLCEGTLR